MKMDDLFGSPEPLERTWKDGEAWLAHAVRVLDQKLQHGEVMAEDFWSVPGLGRPSSRATESLLAQRALDLGVIKHTGRLGRSKKPKNKGHKYEIYQRPGFPK